MLEHIEIKGGADEFEAAVVAVIIDRLTRDETAARQSPGSRGPGLPAWVCVIKPSDPRNPREIVWPD